MKKILIFYGSYGAGHLSAARSIQEYLDSHYENVETKLLDCIEYANKAFSKITTKAYDEISKKAPLVWEKLYEDSMGDGPITKLSNASNKMMSNKLMKLMKEFKPDLIVSTHPFASQMCTILKMEGKINCKIATVLTDYAPHSQWTVNSEYIDYFFIAHEGIRKQVVNLGVASEKIYATGIPLSTKFLAHFDKDKILNEFNLKPNKTTILFFAGGSSHYTSKNIEEIFESFLNSFPDIQLIVITGRNPKMKKHFDEVVDFCGKQDKIKILSFTDKIPELMHVSDLVITKPGGLTTTESLACGLPIIVINPIPRTRRRKC